jgi:hypothetical protein
LIHEDETVEGEGLSEETKKLRPDMVFERRIPNQERGRNPEIEEKAVTAAAGAVAEDGNDWNETRITEIFELSYSYGHMSHGRNVLE